MNNKRRKTIALVINSLENLSADWEDVAQEESDAYENMPESIQQSDRGSNIEDNIYDLEDCISQINDVIDTLSSMIE